MWKVYGVVAVGSLSSIAHVIEAILDEQWLSTVLELDMPVSITRMPTYAVHKSQVYCTTYSCPGIFREDSTNHLLPLPINRPTATFPEISPNSQHIQAASALDCRVSSITNARFIEILSSRSHPSNILTSTLQISILHPRFRRSDFLARGV